MAENSMTENHRRIVDEILKRQLIRELNLDAEFFAIMREEDCITILMEDSVMTVRQSRGNFEAASEFLKYLRKRPDRVFTKFLVALWETHQRHLVTAINEELIRMHEEPFSRDAADQDGVDGRGEMNSISDLL